MELIDMTATIHARATVIHGIHDRDSCMNDCCAVNLFCQSFRILEFDDVQFECQNMFIALINKSNWNICAVW